MTIPDRDLLRYLAGAAEPSRALEVEEQLSRDPALQQRLAVLSAELQAAAAPPRWFIPPPALAAGPRAFAVSVAPVAVMSSGDLRPGERFAMRFDDPDDQPRLLVVLHREEGRWQVLFPQSATDVLHTSELPTDDNGQRVLELAAGAEPGDQRWAVALPTPLHGPNWAAEDPWVGMRDAMGRGEVPVRAAAVRVA